MRVRTLLAHVLQRHLAPPPLRSSFGASARGAYGHGRLRVLRRTGISSFDRDGRRLHPFSACEVDAISIEFFAIPLLFFFGQACLRDCLRLARDLCLSTDICPDAGCKRRGLRDSQLHVIPSVIPGVHLIFLLPSSTCVGQVFSFGCRVSLSVNRCLAPPRPRHSRLGAVPTFFSETRLADLGSLTSNRIHHKCERAVVQLRGNSATSSFSAKNSCTIFSLSARL